MMSVTYNPADPAVMADPYPALRRLQDEEPAHWSEALRAWVITRYDDVATVLKDPRFSAERVSPFFSRPGTPTEGDLYDMMRSLGLWLVFSDPPRHTRLRQLVNRAFTPHAVERIRPRIAALVDELLAEVAERGEMDVIHDLAYPLPAMVIAAMLGVPKEDHRQFKDWSDELALFVGGSLTTSGARERAQRSSLALSAYMRRMVAERRREPADDILSALIAAEERGDALGEDEVVATCNLLLFAGHETTTNLIGNAVLALLRNPAELALLREPGDLIVPAVEEFLRYDGPIGAMGRIAIDEVELGSRTIARGARVYAMINAANRDPREFTDPDRLDIRRADNRHLAFGFSIHYCLGAPLARAEAQLALGALTGRFTNLALAGAEPEWNDSLTLRGLRSLPITFSAR